MWCDWLSYTLSHSFHYYPLYTHTYEYTYWLTSFYVPTFQAHGTSGAWKSASSCTAPSSSAKNGRNLLPDASPASTSYKMLLLWEKGTCHGLLNQTWSSHPCHLLPHGTRHHTLIPLVRSHKPEDEFILTPLVHTVRVETKWQRNLC